MEQIEKIAPTTFPKKLINNTILKGDESDNYSSDSDYDSKNIKGQINRYQQNTNERKLLSHWVIWVVTGWLICVIAIMTFQGLSVLSLDKEVCITLLATTTVNILGLAYIVLKGLFGD